MDEHIHNLKEINWESQSWTVPFYVHKDLMNIISISLTQFQYIPYSSSECPQYTVSTDRHLLEVGWPEPQSHVHG